MAMAAARLTGRMHRRLAGSTQLVAMAADLDSWRARLMAMKAARPEARAMSDGEDAQAVCGEGATGDHGGRAASGDSDF